MSEVFDPSQFSNEPLPDIGEWEDWQEDVPTPLEAGTYDAIISEQRDVKQLSNGYLQATLDFRAIGGLHDGRSVATFVRVTNQPKPFGNKASQMTDILRGAGLDGAAPQSNADYVRLLKLVADQQMRIGTRMEWRAFCTPCFDAKAAELTGATAGDAARAALKLNKAHDKEARAAGTKATNMKKFLELSGGRPTYSCAECGGEVQARAEIRNFFKAS